MANVFVLKSDAIPAIHEDPIKGVFYSEDVAYDVLTQISKETGTPEDYYSVEEYTVQE